MIRFACPSCKTVLQIADGQAGAVVACPRCKTRLQSPKPAANAAPPPPTPAVAAQPPPQHRVAPDPPPAPDKAAAPRAGSGVKVFMTSLLHEVVEILRGTWEQTRRLIAYGVGRGREPGLRRAEADAGLALGERMAQTGAGDAELRGRITTLDEKIRVAEAAKKPTGALKAERRSLVRQLAAPALAWTAPPPGLEKEYARLRDAQAALEVYADTMKAARTALPPAGGAGWRRVLIGYGAVVGLAVMLLLCGGWFFYPTKTGGRPPEGRPGDPSASFSDPPAGKLFQVEKPIWSVKGGQFWSSVSRLAFLPDGKSLLARGDNGEAKVYTLEKGEESPPRGFLVRSKEQGLVNLALGWEDESLFAKYLADDRHADLQAGIRSVATQSFHPLDDARKFLSPDGKTLATAIEPLALRLWDAETGKVKDLELQAEDKEENGSYNAFSIAFSPDGGKLAVWGKSGLKIWDVRTGKLLAHLTREAPVAGQDAPILFSPDGALVAANRPADHTAPVVWDCAAWQVRCVLNPEGAGNFRVRAFSADHKIVVTTDGATRYHVTLWDSAKGEKLHRTDPVDAREVFFHPDGRSLIAGGDEVISKAESPHDVLIWDAVGRLTHRVTDDRITAVAVAPGGKLLATGNMKAEIKLWDLTKVKAFPFESEAAGSGTRGDPIKLPASQLFSEYAKDRVNAVETYSHKWLAVSGQVVKQDKTPAGRPDAVLVGLRASAEGDVVSCYFDRQDADQLKRLDDPDYPPIIGECQGAGETDDKKPTVVLTRCFIPRK